MDEVLKKIKELLDENVGFVLITVVKTEGSAPSTTGQKMLILQDGESIGSVGGGSIEKIAIEKGKKILINRGNLFEEYTLKEDGIGMACGGNVSLFYEYIGPDKTLYIFGGGHIGKNIAEIMSGAGYNIIVVDPRGMDIPGVKNVKRAFSEFIRENTVEDGSFIVVCTPEHRWDYQVLKELDGRKPAYIGLVASKRKLEGILKKLKEETKNFPFEVLHSPAGLKIGGRSPREIAISISAEIQKVRYGL